MILDNFLEPLFDNWEFEIYDEDGNLIISTYERDCLNDLEWLSFIELYKEVEVIEVIPMEAKNFLGLRLAIKL